MTQSALASPPNCCSPRRRCRLGASKQQALQARCDMGHRHDQDLAIEPNLAMSAASDATNST